MFLSIAFIEILLLSCVICVLYAWFGLCFASSMIMAMYLIGYHNLRHVISAILIAQIAVAMLSSVVRRSIVPKVSASMRSGIIIGIAAIASFVAAYTVGIRLVNTYRLALNGALLMLAALVNLVCSEGTRTDVDLSGSALTGLIAGGVKGALGGGTTGIMIVMQRLRGRGFDDALFRTLVSHAFICSAAALPYAIAFGIDISVLVPMVTGSLGGVCLGWVIQRLMGGNTRRRASSALMGLFSALLFFESVESALGASI